MSGIVNSVAVPKRIQLKRTKGWRKPPGAIVVARPTKYGNPFKVERVWDNQFGWQERAVGLGIATLWSLVPGMGTVDAVALFRLHVGPLGLCELEPSDLAELRGHDLACWCPLVGQPCHADVLLELANA